MGQTHYPQIIRDEAVLFYERCHTFAETHIKYGRSESTFYAWKKKFDLTVIYIIQLSRDKSLSF